MFSLLKDDDIKHYIKIGIILIFIGIFLILLFMFFFKPSAKISIKKTVEYGENITSIGLIKEVKGQNIQDATITKGSMTFPDLEITASEIDPMLLGEQTLTYSFSDGSEDIKETITVKDTEKPVIKLKEKEITMPLNKVKEVTWEEYYTVTDNYKDYPTIKESLDKDTYTYGDTIVLTIKAIDYSNNTSEAKMMIHIEKKKEEVKQEKKEEQVQEQQVITQQKEPDTTAEENLSLQQQVQQIQEPIKAQPISKDYLFSAGYDMSSAPTQCQLDLQNSGLSGTCIPIQDENGIYLGMRLTTY